jgi:hypothetical protein
MTRSRLAFCLFGAALFCGLVLIFVSDMTVVPMVSKGSGPGGIQVTTGGWAAFFVSLIGTCGCSLACLIVSVVHYLNPHDRTKIRGELESDQSKFEQIAELTESFASLMKEQASRAAQRRFVFSLVDAADMIDGCQTSHENGVIIIRYSGYADPTVPSDDGGTK